MVVLFASGVLIDTTICTVPDAPDTRLPMFQVTTPAASEPSPVADTKVVLAGTVSLMTTLVAFALPVFEYDSVYVRLLPAAIGSGASVFVIARTGVEETVTVTVAPLTGPTSLLVML